VPRLAGYLYDPKAPHSTTRDARPQTAAPLCSRRLLSHHHRPLRPHGACASPVTTQVFWSGVTNICGNPSTAFPAGRAASAEGRGASGQGMPVGLQAVGAEWNDLTTIAFARALQEEAGFGFVAPAGY
jgi:Asp-tRNA(Asn)/Glu-tRNA(Gln) amidotransferase A subunit family amidase